MIQLLRVSDGQGVDAILTEVTDKHLEDTKGLWKLLLKQSGQDDEYWSWIGKSRRARFC